MKKLLFGMAALVVAGAIVTIKAAPTSASKWVLSSSVYELDGVLYADGFIGGSTSLKVSDFTGDGDFLVGTGVGTFAAESGATARTSLGLTIGTDVLAPDGDGTSLTGVALDTEVWAAPTASEAANNLENVVTIQAQTLAGGNLEERRLIRVWVSGTDYGTASTNNIASLVLSTGVAVDTVTENADYRYVTAADGSAVATITAEATAVHYLMVADGSSISSTEITFTSP